MKRGFNHPFSVDISSVYISISRISYPDVTLSYYGPWEIWVQDKYQLLLNLSWQQHSLVLKPSTRGKHTLLHF